MLKKKTKTSIVLGGTGFIGSALLSGLPDTVISISRTKKPKLEAKYPHVKFLYKSIKHLTHEDIVYADTIFYCASTTDNFGILENPHKDIDINLNQLVSFLEKIKSSAQKPKIIYLSTFFVYGNYYDAYQKRVNEETPTDPLSLYSATKLCAESILKLYGRMYDIPIVICRLSNIYGVGDQALHKKGVLNYFIKLAKKNKDLTLYDNGNFVRDYVYIDDLISALVLIQAKANNDTFLIASGTSTSFKNVIETICKLTGSTSKFSSIQSPTFHRAVGVTSFKADISKLRSLGWKPKVTLKEGLKRIIRNSS